MIIQVEHAISDDDCRRLTAIYDLQAHLTNAKDHTGYPVVYWDRFRELPSAAEIVLRLVENYLGRFCQLLQPEVTLYPETVILAALGVGGCHSRHADNCRQNEQGDWVPNHTPQRDVTAIYYLSDEFEGGEIVFDRQQLTVKPRRGLLLAFRSDGAYAHEVLPVRGGIRYTLVIWFTQQERFAIAACRGSALPGPLPATHHP